MDPTIGADLMRWVNGAGSACSRDPLGQRDSSAGFTCHSDRGLIQRGCRWALMYQKKYTFLTINYSVKIVKRDIPAIFSRRIWALPNSAYRRSRAKCSKAVRYRAGLPRHPTQDANHRRLVVAAFTVFTALSLLLEELLK